MAKENQLPQAQEELAFSRTNYLLMIAGSALVVIGFFLMSGGGSEDPSQFNEQIFSFRRVTLAPLSILTGYGVVMYAVMKKPRD